MKTRFLIWGYYGYQNTGDEFMLSVLKSFLKKLFPQSSIKVISANPSFTEKIHRLESVYNSFAVKSGILPFICKRLLDFKAILKCDVFIFGGGTFLTNPEGINTKSLLVHLINIIFARSAGKKIMFLGVGAENLKTKKDRLIVRLMFLFVHKAFLRDSESIELLKNIGISQNKLVLSSDLAYMYKMKPKALQNNGRKKAAICPFAFFKNIERNDLKHQKMLSSFRKLIAELVSLNFEVHLIPFQDDKTISDFSFIQGIYNGLKSRKGVIVHKYRHDFAETLNLVRDMDVLIGMRFHSIVFSIISGVPFLALEYSGKIKSLTNASRVGNSLITQEVFINCPEKTAHRAAEIAGNKNIKKQLKFFLKEQKKLSEKNFEEMECIVK